MTCIVAVAKDGKVYMGGDSCAGSSSIAHTVSRPKVFRKKVTPQHELIIGYTTSFRMGQVLEHGWDVPAHEDGKSDYDYLVGVVVPSIIKLYKSNNYGSIKDGEDANGGIFLLGYKGKVYHIQSDFSVLEPMEGYHSVGSGMYLALGSLHSTEKEKDQKKRIEMALEAAVAFNPYVLPPFVIDVIE